MKNKYLLAPKLASLFAACFFAVSPFGNGCMADDSATFKHQVTGLFCKERVADLHKVMVTLPELKLVKVDFEQALADFNYDAAAMFPGAKPEQVVERLNSMLQSASNRTFGVKPLSTIPQSSMQFVEIEVAGLDCMACSLAAYEAIFAIEGVERATASFKERRVTAWIDPKKTDRAALEESLRKKGVAIP